MAYFVAIGVIIIIIGAWNIMIGILGLFPKFRAETIGTLTKANTYRNMRGKYGTIPIQTWYAYTYTVRGRKYKYSNVGYYAKRRLLPKARMIYIKCFPRHAYPYKLKGTKEWVLGICFLVIGLIYVYLIISEGGIPV